MGATIALSVLTLGSIIMGLVNRNKAWWVPIVTFAALLVANLASAPWWIYAGLGALGLIGIGAVIRRHRGKSIAPSVAGGGLVVAALVVGLVGVVGAGGTANADATNAPDADTVKALTVTTIGKDAKCLTDKNGLVPYTVDALKPVGKDGRKWSDAISTPFVANEPAKMLAEVRMTICNDPLYGAQVANYFANLKLGKGSDAFAVLSVNPWLDEFKGDGAKVINTKAAGYITLLNVDNPTEAQVTEAVKQNRAWQAVAAKLNTLLGKFIVGDVHADQSILNYHLLGGGLAADTLPAVGLNDKQENLPALQLYLTQKAQKECVVRVGFNTGDKRVEQFSCATPPKPTVTPSRPGTTTETPGCKTNCGPTETPECKHNCTTETPPPGCKTNCTTTPPPKCVPPKPYGTYPECYGPKPSASQPPGVEHPTDNPVGSPEPKPTPKTDPLRPSTGGGTSQAPGSTPVTSYSPPPPATGAPEPSTAPSTCVPPPGKTSC